MILLRRNITVLLFFIVGGTHWVFCQEPIQGKDSLTLLLQELDSLHRSQIYTPLFKQKAQASLQIAQDQKDTIGAFRSIDFMRIHAFMNEDSLRADSLFKEELTILSKRGYEVKEVYETVRENYLSEFNYALLRNTLRVFVDSSNSLSLPQILDSTIQKQFTVNTQRGNSKFDPDVAYWIKLRLRTDSFPEQKMLLLPGLDHQVWHDLRMYHKPDGQTWQETLSGSMVPRKDREIKDWRNLFWVNLPAYTQDHIVYFRLQGFENDNRPYILYIGHLPNKYVEEALPARQWNLFIFWGILIFHLIYILLLSISTRETLYLNYAVYITGIIFFLLCNYKLYDWLPNIDRFAIGNFYMFGIWIAGLGLWSFSVRFLNTFQLYPKLSRFNKFFYIIYSLPPLLYLLVDGFFFDLFPSSWRDINTFLEYDVDVFFLNMGIGLVLLLIMGILSARKQYSPARFFLLSLLFLFGTVGIMGLLESFSISRGFDIGKALIASQIGCLCQLCTLALGIGHKRRLLEKDKVQAQEQLLEEQSKVTTAFGRFVPKDFLKAIGRESVLDVQLGDGVEQKVTVFFSDIRQYTTLAETMKPKENFRFLNGYLGRLGPIITENQGFVNQYYGDGIMAIFMENPITALKASIEIQKALKTYNQERSEKKRPVIKVGIGLHTGPLIMGIIGDSLRMEAGVVSDTVNTASRMEGLTKHFGVNILVSETVFDQLPKDHGLSYRFLGLVQVKGKKEPLRIYDFFDGDDLELFSAKKQSLSLFETGMKAYFAKDFALAAQSFEKVLDIWKDDLGAKNYLARSKSFLLEGTPENWSGVEAPQAK